MQGFLKRAIFLTHIDLLLGLDCSGSPRSREEECTRDSKPIDYTVTKKEEGKRLQMEWKQRQIHIEEHCLDKNLGRVHW